ncbi:Phosphate ABC transporter, periplasmic phosphate-binding protein PstS (TC 3.A.1.7.1) [plant metagenome]|uniref:Phosphate ABC transporter, periplasmic phosphate-binding protein PstS (TC 3.A.1.7.1) n=1 Tax=plant metagenome TaxID=1297885 RepID=A0A484NTV3_9ZZZZ
MVGGGATLPEALYNDLFTRTSPGFLDYVGVGSGAGKRAFFNNNATEFGLPAGTTVDYAGSDSLVTAGEASAYVTNSKPTFGALIQVPAVLTSVTVPYNVPGLAAPLQLTSQQLAEIFSREVTNWSQVEVSPGVFGPDLGIVVVFRNEEAGSGTTEIFLRHLNAIDGGAVPSVSNRFATVFGFDRLNPPAGYVGASGSAAIVPAIDAAVANAPATAPVGAIGYVSPDFSDFDNEDAVVAIRPAPGQAGVLPTEVNVQSAVSQVPVPTTSTAKADPLAWGISNAAPTAGYPIVASTNLIFSQCYQSAADRTRIRTALNNLYGTAGTWDNDIRSHSFIPLPADWKAAIHQTFYNLSDAEGLAIGASACSSVAGRPNVNN